jgi:hypothetical protein
VCPLLFDPDFCNDASGWEKGRVAKNVQDSRRRIWIEATRRRFGSFVELNAWLGERCRALWGEVRHPEHGQFSVAEMLEHERPHLMPMPEPFDGYVEKPARVSSTCLVSVARNRYSVPCELAGQMVSTRLYPGGVVVVADDAVVARYERMSDSVGTRYEWQHYIPLVQRKPGELRNGAPFADMPEALQRLRRGLRRQVGGDRAMAQVLAIVLTASLDAVIVAVELAMENGPPCAHRSTGVPASLLAIARVPGRHIAAPAAVASADNQAASACAPGLALRNASSCAHAASTRAMCGQHWISMLKRRALSTCGTKYTSATVGAPPKQNSPRAASAASRASMAPNPALIHVLHQAFTAASSAPNCLRRHSSTRRLLMGWISLPTIDAKARTRARSSGFAGSRAGSGYRSSSHSMIAGDCVKTVPSCSRTGTRPWGLSALKDVVRCSSVRRFTGIASTLSPLRLRAMRSL